MRHTSPVIVKGSGRKGRGNDKPVIPRYQRPKHELHHIQKYPDGKERPYRNLTPPSVSPASPTPLFPLSLPPPPKSRTLTSKQYPNSNPSPSSLSPAAVSPNSPLLLPPLSPLLPGPNSLPTRKYAAVAMRRENRRKWMKMNIKVRRIVAPMEFVEAIPQARPVTS